MAAPITLANLSDIPITTTTTGSSVAMDVSMTGGGADSVIDGLITTGSVTSAAVVLSASNVGFGGGSFQITSAGTGNTITWEQSNDNATWTNLITYNETSTAGTGSATNTSAALYKFSSSAAYVRARVSTYGSGTVTIVLTQKRSAQQVAGMTLATSAAQIGSLVNMVGYTDSIANLGMSATFTGIGRAVSSSYNYFQATVYADQVGTLYLEQSLDTGANYYVVASVAVAAGVAQTLKTPTMGAAGTASLYRVRYLNGGVAQTVFRLSSALTAN